MSRITHTYDDGTTRVVLDDTKGIDMDKIKQLETARLDLIAKRERLDDYVRNFDADSEAIKLAESITAAVAGVEWALRVCRAALVVAEERTPDGVSDTVIDELCKAVGS